MHENNDTASSCTGDPIDKNLKIFKKKGCRIESGNDLLRAWKIGNALIFLGNGSMANYTDAVRICGESGIVDIISEVKQSDFDGLKKSPTRQLRARNR